MKPRGGTTQKQEVLEESRREPRFATKRRSPQHGTSQRSGEWARATRRARRAAQDHPASPTFGTSVGLVRNTGSTRSHLEQASVKATTLHTYQQHYAEWMRCRQHQKNLSTPTSLEMAMIQYFDHLFYRSDSPRVAERKQLGSATPGSGGAFRSMGPALVPSRRRACEQNPAARRHNFFWIRQAARGWDRWST